MSLYLWYAAIDFGIQWAGFVVASTLGTEKFYDLTGSLTFVVLSICSYKWSNASGIRKTTQTGMILIWAVRLGSYLFTRILHDGKDKRFDKIKTNMPRFFVAWTLQGVWVMANLLPSLVMISNRRNAPLSTRDYLGWGLWTFGFLFEVIADHQKSAFRKNPLNQGKFISHGLWSVSRHPNYFGEILLWIGLFMTASSGFSGTTQTIALLGCPTFTAFLITRVSGIPLLEKSANAKWGQETAYKKYLENTAVLIPYIW